MQKFTDMYGRTICDGAKIYYNGCFPEKMPMEKRIREGIAIIDGDNLVFCTNINGQLRGVGLYWELDGEPCYDLTVEESTSTKVFIEALQEQLPNERVIPIFGGALWIDSTDVDAIINYLPTIISNAKFWKWHGGLADACRQFCHCLFIDPALIEARIGMKFETLTKGV